MGWRSHPSHSRRGLSEARATPPVSLQKASILKGSQPSLSVGHENRQNPSPLLLVAVSPASNPPFYLIQEYHGLNPGCRGCDGFSHPCPREEVSLRTLQI